MSILRRKKKMKLSVDAVAHLFSIMSSEDRRTVTRLLDKLEGVMPKTKKQLRDLPNHKLVSKVLTQEFLHKNKHIDYHKVGSLFDAIHSLWNVGKAVLKHLFGHVSEHENNRKLTEQENEMAKLVSAAYEKERPKQVDGWTLLDKYESKYAAVYQNSAGDVCVAIRGTKLSLSDIGKDMQIMASNLAKNSDVDRIFREVQNDFPGQQKYTTAHSLGSVLVKHGISEMGEAGKDFKAFLFNCGSSPFLNTAEWKNFLKAYNPMIFANKGDPINAGLLESLPNDYGNIIYNPKVSAAIWRNHSLNQWISEEPTPINHDAVVSGGVEQTDS